MSKKGIQSVCFRVRLKGQGIVNYGDTNQAAMRLELCHQHGVDYDDVKKSNQQFAKVNYQAKDLWNAKAKPFTTRVKGRKRGQTVGARTSVVVPSHDVVTYRLTPVL